MLQSICLVTVLVPLIVGNPPIAAQADSTPQEVLKVVYTYSLDDHVGNEARLRGGESESWYSPKGAWHESPVPGLDVLITKDGRLHFLDRYLKTDYVVEVLKAIEWLTVKDQDSREEALQAMRGPFALGSVLGVKVDTQKLLFRLADGVLARFQVWQAAKFGQSVILRALGFDQPTTNEKYNSFYIEAKRWGRKREAPPGRFEVPEGWKTKPLTEKQLARNFWVLSVLSTDSEVRRAAALD